jgi:hypothetical protein
MQLAEMCVKWRSNMLTARPVILRRAATKDLLVGTGKSSTREAGIRSLRSG